MTQFTVTFREDKCKGCELCVSVCPKKLLVLREDLINRKGYHPAGITSQESCIGCASCALMCPDGVIRITAEE